MDADGVRGDNQGGRAPLKGAIRRPSGAESSGGERTRTAVQTSCQAAFYMLILPLVFEAALPEGGRSYP